MGEVLERALRQLVPRLKEIKRLGLLKAVEFSTEPDCRRTASDVARTCLANGAAVYTCSPAVDAVLLRHHLLSMSNKSRSWYKCLQRQYMRCSKKKELKNWGLQQSSRFCIRRYQEPYISI